MFFERIIIAFPVNPFSFELPFTRESNLHKYPAHEDSRINRSIFARVEETPVSDKSPVASAECTSE